MAFKMKAGKEGPMKKNFGISPMKNYKKGYYGEGSSMKYRPPSHGTGMRPLTGEDKAKLEEMTGEIRPRIRKEIKPKLTMKAVRKKLVPTSRYTGRKPQSQMTDAEYKRMLQNKKK